MDKVQTKQSIAQELFCAVAKPNQLNAYFKFDGDMNTIVSPLKNAKP